jgi:hypothetical protein
VVTACAISGPGEMPSPSTVTRSSTLSGTKPSSRTFVQRLSLWRKTSLLGQGDFPILLQEVVNDHHSILPAFFGVAAMAFHPATRLIATHHGGERSVCTLSISLAWPEPLRTMLKPYAEPVFEHGARTWPASAAHLPTSAVQAATCVSPLPLAVAC